MLNQTEDTPPYNEDMDWSSEDLLRVRGMDL